MIYIAVGSKKLNKLKIYEMDGTLDSNEDNAYTLTVPSAYTISDENEATLTIN